MELVNKEFYTTNAIILYHTKGFLQILQDEHVKFDNSFQALTFGLVEGCFGGVGFNIFWENGEKWFSTPALFALFSFSILAFLPGLVGLLATGGGLLGSRLA